MLVPLEITIVKNLMFVPAAAIGVLLAACCGTATAANAPIALVPQPRSVQPGTSGFVLDGKTVIVVDKDSAEAMSIGKQLAERIRRGTGLELAVVSGASREPGAIWITTRKASATGALAKPVAPKRVSN